MVLNIMIILFFFDKRGTYSYNANSKRQMVNVLISLFWRQQQPKRSNNLHFLIQKK